MTQKNQAYHQAAIEYNEGLAVAAEELAPTLEHDEVKKWCIAVGKQHRFHAKRHRSALEKLKAKEESAPVEIVADGLDVPVPVENLEAPIDQSHSVTAVEKFSDGCVGEHKPMSDSCEFNPNRSNNG